MKTVWILLPLGLVTFASATIASANFLFLEKDLSLSSDASPAVRPASQSSSLKNSVEERINVDSRIAMEAIAEEDARKIVLENAFFSRGNGIVSGTGRFWDGRAPRVIRIFIDAYGDGPDVLESFPIDIRTTGVSQEFALQAPDKATFTRFAFRFTSEGEPVLLSSPSDDQLNIATVSSNAMLFSSDFKEVDELLEAEGFLSKGSRETVAVLEDVRRFRRANGIDGPSFVTIGDLYALRIESGIQGRSMKILPYVLWASSLGGGRAIARPRYTPDRKLPSPDEQEVVAAEEEAPGTEEQISDELELTDA